MNAIERLREVVEIVDDISEMNDEMVRGGTDALAAVDALHQAAKEMTDYSAPIPFWELARRKDALAAAVRRVDGEA